MILASYGNDEDHELPVDYLIDQPVSGIAKFDFVGILQIAVQFGQGYMRRKQALGELFDE